MYLKEFIHYPNLQCMVWDAGWCVIAPDRWAHALVGAFSHLLIFGYIFYNYENFRENRVRGCFGCCGNYEGPCENCQIGIFHYKS